MYKVLVLSQHVLDSLTFYLTKSYYEMCWKPSGANNERPGDVMRCLVISKAACEG